MRYKITRWYKYILLRITLFKDLQMYYYYLEWCHSCTTKGREKHILEKTGSLESAFWIMPDLHFLLTYWERRPLFYTKSRKIFFPNSIRAFKASAWYWLFLHWNVIRNDLFSDKALSTSSESRGPLLDKEGSSMAWNDKSVQESFVTETRLTRRLFCRYKLPGPFPSSQQFREIWNGELAILGAVYCALTMHGSPLV